MTRRSILEYVQALRSRYLGASKEGNSKMLASQKVKVSNAKPNLGACLL